MHADPAHATEAVPYTRLTVLAPRRRVDVALPGDVPVGELVPMVLELVGEPGPGPGPRPWRLTGATGGPLHPAATLDELGVLDGELLRLGPHAAAPPPPVFDDPVDALAAQAGRPVPATTPGGVPLLTLAVSAAALLAMVGAAPDGGGWAVAAAAVALLGAAAALARAALLLRDADPPDGTGARATTAALAAVPPGAAAAATAAAALPGAAQLLLAAAGAGATAALGLVVLRRAQPVLVAVVVAALPVGVAAALHLRLELPVGAPAAGIAALALVVGPLLPRVALRLAGLPLPVIPADAGELSGVDDGTLPPGELAARAALARSYLAGLVAGCAVPAAVAAPLVAGAGGWTGPVLAGMVVAVLGLRARGFADPAPRRTLLAACTVAAVLVAAGFALVAPAPARLLVAVLVLGAAAVVAVTADRPPAGSPVTRRAVDIVEGVLVALSVPVAFGAMGLFELVRGL